MKSIKIFILLSGIYKVYGINDSSCPCGQYFDQQFKICLLCPAGTYNKEQYMTGISSCEPCLNSDAVGSCSCHVSNIPAANPTYLLTLEPSSVILNFPMPTSTAETACGCGEYFDLNYNLCVLCPLGTYNDLLGNFL